MAASRRNERPASFLRAALYTSNLAASICVNTWAIWWFTAWQKKRKKQNKSISFNRLRLRKLRFSRSRYVLPLTLHPAISQVTLGLVCSQHVFNPSLPSLHAPILFLQFSKVSQHHSLEYRQSRKTDLFTEQRSTQLLWPSLAPAYLTNKGVSVITCSLTFFKTINMNKASVGNVPHCTHEYTLVHLQSSPCNINVWLIRDFMRI